MYVVCDKTKLVEVLFEQELKVPLLLVWALRAAPLRDGSTELINAGASDVACAYISYVMST